MEDETVVPVEEIEDPVIEDIQDNEPAIVEPPQVTLEQAYAILAQQRPDLLAAAQQAVEEDDDETELTWGEWSSKTKNDAMKSAYTALSVRSGILDDLRKISPEMADLGETVLENIDPSALVGKDARMIITRAIVGDAVMTGKLTRTTAPSAGNKSVSNHDFDPSLAPHASAFEQAFGFKITDKEIKEALGGVN
jgi:hypothetical protein